MLPSKWGKYGWGFLHAISLNYPDNPTEEDKKHFIAFFVALMNVLPCLKCRYNYAQHLKKIPITETVLSSKENLVKWLIDLHNLVNHATDKRMLSYDEAYNELCKMFMLDIYEREYNELDYDESDGNSQYEESLGSGYDSDNQTLSKKKRNLFTNKNNLFWLFIIILSLIVLFLIIFFYSRKN
jgi:hypothetical protein